MKRAKQHKEYKLKQSAKVAYWKKFVEYLNELGIEEYTEGKYLLGYRLIDSGKCASVEMIMQSIMFDRENPALRSRAYPKSK